MCGETQRGLGAGDGRHLQDVFFFGGGHPRDGGGPFGFPLNPAKRALGVFFFDPPKLVVFLVGFP